MTKLFLIPLVAVALTVLPACNQEASVEEIVQVSPDDAEMNAAMDKARSTVGEFVAAREAGGEAFGGLLKVYFVDSEDDDGEHMWVDVTSIDGDAYSGVLLSSPGWLTSVSAGDSVDFGLEDISDWLFVGDDGKAVGAHSVQVLRSRMSDEERELHDQGYPFSFD